MAAITLKGIRLESVGIERNEKSGSLELKAASYSLLSSTDHVLANQTIGGYGSQVAVVPSASTVGALASVHRQLQKRYQYGAWPRRA